MIRLILVLMGIALPMCQFRAAADNDVLLVRVNGVRSAKGHVLVAVCDRASFPAPTCAFHGEAPAHAGTVVVRVTGVPAGIYAVEAYHDENDNNRLDRNFLGIPEEGMGFSRDAAMRFGPPDFADAAVTVSAAGGAVSFGLRYFH